MRLPYPPENITLAVTGASGALLAREMLQQLERDARVAAVNFIASEHSLRVIAEELGLAGRSEMVERLLGAASGKIRALSNTDIGATVASGSYPVGAMIVLPCSMGTLSKIAHGSAEQLIERAADVCLKEQRPLVLCLRETPFNKIHIRNMALAADAGATIFPVIPAFYTLPTETGEMAREFVHRVLAFIGLPQADAYEWSGRAR